MLKEKEEERWMEIINKPIEMTLDDYEELTDLASKGQWRDDRKKFIKALPLIILSPFLALFLFGIVLKLFGW